ncbi:hypothetical protein K470DRAFT_271629 [Piedraia hortae CBS 480.64]|uniref:Uncharacterized protein n=1 Tax=Piedraia hortae CBS 480.64 TaxID=1314780 RepID=A0A6A7BVZ3_9PEZI|nr:hypothetical protein K470DRAFT_271629 [Piedraia hortae CBS 480.64]
MVKPLTFKNSAPKPAKKRKRVHDIPPPPEDAVPEEEEGWITVTNVEQIRGPVMLVFCVDNESRDERNEVSGGEHGKPSEAMKRNGHSERSEPPTHDPQTAPSLPEESSSANPTSTSPFTAQTLFTLNSDLLGETYLSPLPSMETEPWSTTQIWISTRLPGGGFSFKSHLGKYLSLTPGGLRAEGEAVSMREIFNVEGSVKEREDGREGGGSREERSSTGKITSEDPSAKGESFLKGCPSKDISPSHTPRGNSFSLNNPLGTPIINNTPLTVLKIKMQTRFLPTKQTTSKPQEGKAPISKLSLENDAGRALTEEEIRTLKRAKREGRYNETLLDLKAKTSRNDRFA